MKNSIPIFRFDRRRLPPVLARDYRRNVVWPVVQIFASLSAIAAIVLGVLS